ncbi:hypothetical protein [Sphingosinicella sp. BN140058]|uniref:hypothetical protein n=1 Tax=Sphingosinicella sp. BN140058 TaxID=1892855 RepID=UPI00101275F4|nr:hypothetical protein [Sphingosinicella sp. BN140058]QAY76135.1 hypothetical protein ETR14_06025 [Sphingosinicella sp. BN140058]
MSRLLKLLGDGNEAVIDRALAGGWPTLRAWFTRMMPPAKSAPVEIDLPDRATRADVAEASPALIAVMAAGEITPLEANQVSKLLVAHAQLLDVRGRPAVTAGKTVDADAAETCSSAAAASPRGAGRCAAPHQCASGGRRGTIARSGDARQYLTCHYLRRHAPGRDPTRCGCSRTAPAFGEQDGATTPAPRQETGRARHAHCWGSVQ